MAKLMIKLLLIVRYKFGYMVPNIPPFVGGSLYVVKQNTNLSNIALGIVWYPNLNVLNYSSPLLWGTVGLMQSTIVTTNKYNLFVHKTDGFSI